MFFQNGQKITSLYQKITICICIFCCTISLYAKEKIVLGLTGTVFKDDLKNFMDWEKYLGLLDRDGSMVLIGIPDATPQVEPFTLIGRRRSLAGSVIGGIAETQEMLDFCGKHGIGSDIEVIAADKINEAYERTIKGDVRYRFVIDMSSL